MDVKTIFDNVPILLFYKDADNHFVKANRTTADFFGISEQEIEGASCYDLMGKEQAESVHRDDLEVIRSGKPKRNIIEPVRNGWFRTDKIPQKDKNGNIIGIIGFALDITDQMGLQSELNVARKAIEQAPSTIVITDIEGKITYVNSKFSKITGYQYSEVVGKNPRILKSGKMSEDKYKEFWATISSGEVWRGEFINKTKSGELYWELATVSPVKDENDKITHYVKVAEVLSEMKNSILNMWNVLEYANYYVMILDKNLRIILCNQILSKVLGHNSSLEPVGEEFTKYISKDDEYIFKSMQVHISQNDEMSEFLSEIVDLKGKKHVVKWFNSWINSDTHWTFCFGVPIKDDVFQMESISAMREKYKDIISIHRNLIHELKEKHLEKASEKEA